MKPLWALAILAGFPPEGERVALEADRALPAAKAREDAAIAREWKRR